MQLTYQKPGKDHPMFGKVDFIVAAGTQELCYKTGDSYQPVASQVAVSKAEEKAPEVKTQPLYVLSFTINGEPEEMTFKSKKKHDKTKEALEAKGFVKDIQTTVYQILA